MNFFDLYSRQQPFIKLSSFQLHFSRSTSFVSKLVNTVMSSKTTDGRDTLGPVPLLTAQCLPHLIFLFHLRITTWKKKDEMVQQLNRTVKGSLSAWTLCFCLRMIRLFSYLNKSWTLPERDVESSITLYNELPTAKPRFNWLTYSHLY